MFMPLLLLLPFVVILFSVVMGVYLWGVDLLLDAGIRWVYKTLGGV